MKSAFGNFIPPKVEANMAHCSVACNNVNVNANVNNNNSSNNNHNNNSNAKQLNNKANQTPIILQRMASQPIDIMSHSNSNSAHQKSSGTIGIQQQQQPQHQQLLQQQQLLSKNDNKKKAYRRYDKNITFGTPVDDPQLDEEFDFEKNLALFDKRAIWDKIDANQKPDLVS